MCKQIIYRYFYIIIIYNILVSLSCGSSHQLQESQLQYKNCLNIITEKDSTINLEIQKAQELSNRLDKTEEVLANIYLKFGTNVPRNIDGSANPAKLNAFILEENLQLRDQVKKLAKSNDSLISVMQAMLNTEPNIELPTPSKKNKSQGDQQNYIYQLEKNLQTEQVKIKQLQKELNAYSLRLEIIDNERLKEVREINTKLKSSQKQNDSLAAKNKSFEATISELRSHQNQKEEIKLSPKDLKLKEKLKQVETDLEETRNNLIAANKDLEKLRSEKKNAEFQVPENYINKAEHESIISKLNLENSRLNEQFQVNSDELKQLKANKQEQEITIQNQNAQILELSKSASKKSKYEISYPDTLRIRDQKILELKNQISRQDNKHQKEISENQEALKTSSSKIQELNNQISQIDIKHKKEISQNQETLKTYSSKIQELNNQIYQLDIKHQKEISQIQEALKTSSSKIQELNLTQQNLLKENETLKSKDSQKPETRINQETISQRSEPVSKNNSNQAIPPSPSDKTSPEIKAKKPAPPPVKNNTEIKNEKPVPSPVKYNTEIKEDVIVKLEKLVSEKAWPGMSVRSESGSVILVVPQDKVFLNSTLALNEDGSKLIMRIHSILNGAKKNQIDIITYSDPNILSEEFRLNRSITISKLFKALGVPQLNLNTSSRVYSPNVDVEQFKEGLELIIRNL